MGRILRRRIALVVAFSAILAGGTAVALGATATPKHARPSRHTRLHGGGVRTRPGLVSAAASYLGLTTAQLQEQLHSGKSLAQIAAATPGKSEAGLIAAMLAAVKAKIPSPSPALEARIKALVNRTPATELKRHAALGAARHGALRAAVLSYLGLNRHQLITEMKSGKTLAQIADATPGKSAAGLTEAMVNAFKPRLDAAVAAHRLDKTEEAAHVARLKTRIARLLNHTHLGDHRSHAPAGTGTGTAATPAPAA
jgi:hypothetical protein